MNAKSGLSRQGMTQGPRIFENRVPRRTFIAQEEELKETGENFITSSFMIRTLKQTHTIRVIE